MYSFNREGNETWVKKKINNYCTFLSKDGIRKIILRRVPVIDWIGSYQINNFASDFIAGLTMGVYNVPQAMSYSILAGLPPVYGLYASFFPPFLYSIFGSAKHSSIGVFSITCLMVDKCVKKMLKFRNENPEKFTSVQAIEIVTSLCILTGIIQAVMAIFRCDKPMKFLGAPAISAITFSACFFGVVSQIPKLCGFSVPSRNEHWFSLVHSILDIFENCHKSNTATLCISASALVFLIGSRIFIEPFFKNHKKLQSIPFPKELITIVIATSASYFFDFEHRFGVKTLHTVPRGFPYPDVPRIDIWPYIFQDALSIAVVAYAVTMAMGQEFATKHRYRIDSNQELLALGFINIGSSFFSVFPTSASFSRTLVNERSGAKTQLSGITSACFMALVITTIGPYLASLPSCILSAIVIVVLESMLRKCTVLPGLWRCSKHDFWIWIITAVVTLSSDIAQGVAAGIFTAIFTIAIQSQQPTIKLLGQIRPNDFRPMNHYSLAKETSFRIIRFDAPLIFANVEKFLDNVRDSTSATTKKRSASCDSQEDIEWSAIILDCHTWIYTDSMGIAAVKQINEELRQIRILLLFANLKSSLRRQYGNAGLIGEGNIGRNQMYPSIQDALDSAHELIKNHKMFFDCEKSMPPEKIVP